MRIVVVDYGMGNLFSVTAALREMGRDFVVDTDGSYIASGTVALVPGVAAFGAGLRRIRSTDQAAELTKHWRKGKAVLGLCLGAQMFLDSSDEDPTQEGLGFVRGRVQALDSGLGRVPNQGWLKVDFTSSLESSLDEEPHAYYYFSHSFKCSPTDPSVVTAVAVSGAETITAVFQHENVTGIQFHPERSGPEGLRLLSHLLDLGT